MQIAISEDAGSASGRRRQFVCEAEFGSELANLRSTSQERVRAGRDAGPIDRDLIDLAPETRTRFKERDRMAIDQKLVRSS